MMRIGQIAADVPRTRNPVRRRDQKPPPRAEYAPHLHHARFDVFAVQVFKNIQHEHGIEACVRERKGGCVTSYSSPRSITVTRMRADRRRGVANHVLPRWCKSIAGNSHAATYVEHG